MDDDELGAIEERIERTLRGRCDPEAATVTAVAGRTADEVLEAFGADPSEPTVAREDIPFGIPSVSVVQVPGGIVAIEDDGFEGVNPPTLRRASAHGSRAAAMFWNMVGDAAVQFARDGVVSEVGDGIIDHQIGDDPEVRAAFTGLVPDVEDVNLRGLIAVERFTGVRIDAPPADPPMRVHRVLSHLPDLVTNAELLGKLHPFDGDSDGALVEAIGRATPRAQRRLAAWAARGLLAPADLLDDPDLAATVATLDRVEGPVFGLSAELLVRRALCTPHDQPVTVAAKALDVLYRSTNPDPHVAALDAAWHAQRALPRAARPEFPAHALRVLRAP